MSRMTIQDAIDASLRLMNQYSIAGATVPLSYNDQADDIARMIDLINDAQMQIATTVRPIEALYDIVIPDADPVLPITEQRFEMPDGFYRASAVVFTPAHGMDKRALEASYYKWLDDETLLIPSVPAGTYTVKYDRYPERYDNTTDRTTELDNTPDTHGIIPYFVAAMIEVDENPKAYYSHYNIWETRLSRLGMKNPHATITQVTDVYGFDNFRGLW